jgi:hypothetical protein
MKKMSMFNRQMMKVFTKKKNNKGVLWASLISLGASAAVWGITKGKKREINTLPIRNMFKNMNLNKNIPIMNDAALTEFSEELIDKATKNKE